MRETKFRQPILNKDGTLNHWHYWGFIEQYGYLTFAGTETNSSTIEQAHKLSQEFTGLLDKNGTEIFEGDVLQMEDKPRQPGWEVVWYENAWQHRRIGSDPHHYVRLSSQRVIEFDVVIGNIYENKELLGRA